MKHAVIVAHPDPGSHAVSVAKAYCEAVSRCGGEAILRDLYRVPFDPCLRADEIPRPQGFAAGEDVRTERSLIGDADVFALVYPLWFNAPPAMLKGYLDRVFTMGFGYGPISGGGNGPLLTGRKLISFSSSGAPTEWLQKEGAWTAIQTLFDSHFAQVCGLQVVDHIHFGEVGPGLPPAFVQENLARVAEAVERLSKSEPADRAHSGVATPG